MRVVRVFLLLVFEKKGHGVFFPKESQQVVKTLIHLKSISLTIVLGLTALIGSKESESRGDVTPSAGVLG